MTRVACSLLLGCDDDPCAGAKDAVVHNYPIWKDAHCEGDLIIISQMCWIEHSEPSDTYYDAVATDCARTGNTCLNGVCVARDLQCPADHSSFCEGNAVRRCVDQSVAVEAQACVGLQHCFEVEGAGSTRAVCALSEEPCRRAGAYCDGDTRVSCSDGFPVTRELCPESQPRCAELEYFTTCFASECPLGVIGSICDEGKVLTCGATFSATSGDCAALGKLCVSAAGSAFCSDDTKIAEPRWIAVPAGEFIFSPLLPEPERQVALADFEMLKTEVTWTQYQSCVEAGGCPDAASFEAGCIAADANMPFVCATTQAALAYCAWAGGRLPAEAEWQYAATNLGSSAFPWGDAPASCELAVLFDENVSTLSGCGYAAPSVVCSRQGDVTQLGICDLAGNVREFVTQPEHAEAPPEPAGGGFLTPSSTLVLAPSRSGVPPTDEQPSSGFRCVR